PSGERMHLRHAPPGRTSIAIEITVKPCGPHHCPARLGSIHALNTRLRGASKMRVMSNSRSAGRRAELVLAAIVALSFRLQPLPCRHQALPHRPTLAPIFRLTTARALSAARFRILHVFVLVVTTNPVHQVVVWAGLIAALRRQI